MHYFDVPLQPSLYLVEGDPPLLKEFTSYLLVKRAPSLIVDGGNSFNPFTISLFCRTLNKDAMEHIFVSRAFTVFQLKMAIAALPGCIKEENPSVVVVSFFSDLFHSDDVEEEVKTILHQKLLLQLKDMVNYGIPIIVTDFKNNSPVFDCRISFTTRGNVLFLSVDRERFHFPLIPPDQKTLDSWRDLHG